MRAIKKEVLILTLLLAVITAMFWTISRYPALNEKSSKAGQENLTEILTESPFLALDIAFPLWKRISYSTVNWVMANYRGMTFGIVIAGLVLALLQMIKKPRFRNPFLNALAGSFMGAPLGLCVNCSAPVAKGFYNGGMQSTFALSVMFSSPKFNVVIMAMAVSLFPFYLVVIKYLFAAFFIFICLPLLTKIFVKDDIMSSPESLDPIDLDPVASTFTWPEAILATIISFFQNTWYIAKRVVPLMFVAGFLGASAAHLFSFDSFITQDMSLSGAVIVGFVALFLPMPIGVDLLLSEMLFQSGGPIGYVGILMFSLGIYSIYALFIVWRDFSKTLAIAIFATLLVLSTLTGYTVDHYARIAKSDSMEYYLAAMDDIKTRKNEEPKVAELYSEESQVFGDYKLYHREGNVLVESYKLKKREPIDGAIFTKLPGAEFGIREKFLSYGELYEPFFYGRSMASSDYDRDGDPDLAIAKNKGIDLYKNTGGEFRQVKMNSKTLDDLSIHALAFADLNNDRWPDLIVSTYEKGNYVLISDQGSFNDNALIEIPSSLPAITMGFSLADIDKNGYLDICLANWGFGYFARDNAPPAYTRNSIIYNDSLKFTSTPLPGKPGESLSVLFTDFNNDGNTDLLVGNDFSSPDQYYIGGNEGLKLTSAGDSLIRVSPYYTMSMRTADLDNDLLLDTYVTGLNFEGPEENEVEKQYMSESTYGDNVYSTFCENYSEGADRAKCEEMIGAREILPKAEPKRVDVRNCEELKDDLTAYRECLALGMAFEAFKQKDQSLCDLIEGDMTVQRQFCNNYFNYTSPENSVDPDVDQKQDIPQEKGQNALHMGKENNTLKNVTKGSILNNTGWTWNTAFADVDNDGFQDLFAVNGCYEHQKIYNMNYFFKNKGNNEFERVQLSSGLDDVAITHAFLYIDIEGDGDLDIITRSAVGQIYVYRNNEAENNVVTIQLEDELGNREAIGAKVYVTYGKDNELHQMRELTLGGGFMSYQHSNLSFGIGSHNEIHSASITWPDGEKTAIDVFLEANTRYLILRRSTAPITVSNANPTPQR